MEKKFYTIFDIAELLSVSKDTIRRMMRRGEIVYYKIGKQIRLSKSDIEEYIEGQRQKNNKNKS